MDNQKLREAVRTIKVIEDMIQVQKQKVEKEKQKLREFKTSLALWKNKRSEIVRGLDK
jgi:hypothetical protein